MLGCKGHGLHQEVTVTGESECFRLCSPQSLATHLCLEVEAALPLGT